MSMLTLHVPAGLPLSYRSFLLNSDCVWVYLNLLMVGYGNYHCFFGSCKQLILAPNFQYTIAVLQPMLPLFQYATLKPIFGPPVFQQVRSGLLSCCFLTIYLGFDLVKIRIIPRIRYILRDTDINNPAYFYKRIFNLNLFF